MTYWWHLLGTLGMLEAHFEARHNASPYGAILKRTSLRNDILMYGIANGYV